MQRLTMLVNANGQWVCPGSDEFLVTGKALLVEDHATRAVVLGDARHMADASEILFELWIDRVMPSRRSVVLAPWPSASDGGGPAAVIHANGLNSCGATMPPAGVAAAYSSSQYSRGGGSG